MRKLIEAIQMALRAAKVPPNVSAKVISHVESTFSEYGINTLEELLKAPDWYLWLVLIKSLLSPITRMLKSEGYCHANYYIVATLIAFDERFNKFVREWVKSRCKAGLDPCCSNPKCCLVS